MKLHTLPVERDGEFARLQKIASKHVPQKLSSGALWSMALLRLRQVLEETEGEVTLEELREKYVGPDKPTRKWKLWR